MMTPESIAPSTRGRLGRWVLAGWLIATVVLGGALLALHQPLPLPPPQPAAATGRYVLLHALATQCPCSMRVLDYLAARGAHAGVDERVLLVDGDEAVSGRLRARGFTVEPVDAAALAQRYRIEAAPLLVILRPNGSVAYRGAHSPRPQMAPVDLALLDEVRRGGEPSSLALLGCAVSRALQDRLDPLGIKYSLWR